MVNIQYIWEQEPRTLILLLLLYSLMDSQNKHVKITLWIINISNILLYNHNIHSGSTHNINSQIRSGKAPITVTKKVKTLHTTYLSVSLSGQLWSWPSHKVDQWVVRARLTLINRPIYNSSVWDSSSSLHLSAGLGSDSCLAGIHSLEGRAAIRLLTGCLCFPRALFPWVLFTLLFCVCFL